MSGHDASRTALGTAYLRAAHQLLDAAPRILDDPVAVSILGAGAAPRILADAERYQGAALRTMRAHVVLRSRYAEDRLAEAVRRGVRQYVVLGAGFDTFALRQPDWARPLRLWEVDRAGTQVGKRARLAAAGLVLPANARVAEVDLAREPLGGALARHGVSTDTPTFFSWLGVTVYLERPAIDAVLAAVAAHPSGSEIVLTFTQPRVDGRSVFAEAAAGVGEPWVSTFTPRDVEALLREAGFAAVEFLTPELADERYFRHRPRDLPNPKRTSIVSAVR